MRVLLLADEEQQKELCTNINPSLLSVTTTNNTGDLSSMNNFDACIDLLFEFSRDRDEWLADTTIPLVFINSVLRVSLKRAVVRINGWPGFLSGPLIEAVADDPILKTAAENLISLFGKKMAWVPDIDGMISPRIVASIINEAYFALDENVSTEAAIDTAMKLGTNYPYGPFEWGNKIGLQHIHALLSKLTEKEDRYAPAALLTKTALA